MKGRVLFNIIFIIIGLVIGTVVSIYYVRYAGEKAPPGAAGREETGKKILYWQAPMDPTYISDKPGKSPMGMDLIPVYEGEEETMDTGTVKINPVTVQNIGVRTDTVKRTVMKKDIRTIGRIDYDETRLYHIHTKIEGWVEKLFVDFTGQKVRKGDILLKIYSPELVSTQEEYLLAYRSSEKTKGSPFESVSLGMDSLIVAARERLRYWDISDDQIRRLEESGVITKTMDIRSLNRGIVIKKHVREGMLVKPGMNLYTIADMSRLWVYVDVYEYEVPWIKVGQEADMTLASYPGEVFKGRVSFIYPFMEPKTRTVKVRIELRNPGLKLKPEMYANVTLKPVVSRDSLIVPTEAVIRSGERNIAILSRGDGKFTPKRVTLGVEAGGYYEILDGLEEGDKVVTSANFLIDSESRLKEAIMKMLEVKKAGGEEEDRGAMNHGGMKHDTMEGGSMDHPGMEGMDHKKMDHGSMNKGKDMDHSGMEGMTQGSMGSGGKDGSGMKGMDHSSMDMEKVDRGSMDHGGSEMMEHDSMKDGDMDREMEGNASGEGGDGMDHTNMGGTDHPAMEDMDHGH